MENSSAASELIKWIPYKVLVENRQLYFQWLYVGAEKFDDPFFDETISKCMKLPYNSGRYRSITGMDVLSSTYTVKPSAFIFHVSRCGSTLLSQYLSMDEQAIVLPEAPLFDDLLRLHYKTDDVNEAEVEDALLKAIAFTAQKRTGNEKHLFIKLDSWHICFYEKFRKLFPDTPFVFLYRSPDEVIRSNRRQRGMQAVPGIIEPQVFGFDPAEANTHDLDGYFTKVLHCYFQKMSAIRASDANTLFLDYREGSMNMIRKLAAFCSYPQTEKLLAEMEERSRYHSKRPEQVFSEERKQEEVPAYQLELMQLYRQFS